MNENESSLGWYMLFIDQIIKKGPRRQLHPHPARQDVDHHRLGLAGHQHRQQGADCAGQQVTKPWGGEPSQPDKCFSLNW